MGQCCPLPTPEGSQVLSVTLFMHTGLCAALYPQSGRLYGFGLQEATRVRAETRTWRLCVVTALRRQSARLCGSKSSRRPHACAQRHGAAAPRRRCSASARPAGGGIAVPAGPGGAGGPRRLRGTWGAPGAARGGPGCRWGPWQSSGGAQRSPRGVPWGVPGYVRGSWVSRRRPHPVVPLCVCQQRCRLCSRGGSGAQSSPLPPPSRCSQSPPVPPRPLPPSLRFPAPDVAPPPPDVRMGESGAGLPLCASTAPSTASPRPARPPPPPLPGPGWSPEPPRSRAAAWSRGSTTSPVRRSSAPSAASSASSMAALVRGGGGTARGGHRRG